MKSSASQTDNPYASPTEVSRSADDVLCFPDQLQIHAHCELKRLLFRRIRLTGRMDAVLEWDARSVMEVVRVGKRAVLRTVPFWYTPRFEFPLVSNEHDFWIRIDVRLTRGLPIMVRKFRLSIDDDTVYQEGNWGTSSVQLPR